MNEEKGWIIRLVPEECEEEPRVFWPPFPVPGTAPVRASLTMVQTAGDRAQKEPQPPSFRPEKCVLVADDDDRLVLTLSLVLSREGFPVQCAADGGQALELFFQYRPQVVILDYFMPVKNGFQVLQQIRQVAGPREVSVIIITARGLETDVEEAFRIGASDFIIKPFSPRELIARVKAVSALLAHPEAS